jgi:hypothetical protein
MWHDTRVVRCAARWVWRARLTRLEWERRFPPNKSRRRWALALAEFRNKRRWLRPATWCVVGGAAAFLVLRSPSLLLVAACAALGGAVPLVDTYRQQPDALPLRPSDPVPVAVRSAGRAVSSDPVDASSGRFCGGGAVAVWSDRACWLLHERELLELGPALAAALPRAYRTRDLAICGVARRRSVASDADDALYVLVTATSSGSRLACLLHYHPRRQRAHAVGTWEIRSADAAAVHLCEAGGRLAVWIARCSEFYSWTPRGGWHTHAVGAEDDAKRAAGVDIDPVAAATAAQCVAVDRVAPLADGSGFAVRCVAPPPHTDAIAPVVRVYACADERGTFDPTTTTAAAGDARALPRHRA